LAKNLCFRTSFFEKNYFFFFLQKYCAIALLFLKEFLPLRASFARPAAHRRWQEPHSLRGLSARVTFYFYSLLTPSPCFGVWLASISIRFWMIGDAKRLPAEVPRGRSFPLSISPKDIESEGLFPPVR